MSDNYFVGAIPTQFNVLLKALPTKGHIAWEYNPFRNYRLDEDLYEYDGYYYNLYELDSKFNVLLNCEIKKEDGGYIIISPPSKDNKWENNSELIKEAFAPGNNWYREKLIQAISKAKPQSWINTKNPNLEMDLNLTDPVLREKGELVDFVTDELSFNLNHPVDLLPQNSYDDSVNLIMNDGFSYPKLINSRFSPRGKNTYEIVDRKGNADTNIYDRGDLFKTDTSLYKIINTFPKLKLVSVTTGGALKVGNYFFYFRLADSDGNETDFFEESGLVSIFKGGSSYSSVQTGTRDEDSLKQVNFLITNVDSSYSYVYVYYSRTSAEGQNNQYTSYAKIEQKYLINNNAEANILITGFEPITEITEKDLNLTYDLLDASETQASCLNRLFLANVTKPNIPYLELTDLSLYFLPYVGSEKYNVQLTETYLLQSENKGYIDPLYIYDKTGYWNREYYRFGIVYIMKNGELSPVFNVRGAYNISQDIKYTDFELYEGKEKKRKYIEWDEDTYETIKTGEATSIIYENVKGVVYLNNKETYDTINYINFSVKPEVIEELKKYVKGFFFVRLHRIPTILTQGIVIGVDKYGRVPTIPIYGGDIQNKLQDIEKTYITTENINTVNYVSEGFLSRYKFNFENKHSSIWSKIGKITAAVVGVAALAVATVFTFGGAAAIAGVLAGTAIVSSLGVVGTAAVVGAAAIAGSAIVAATTTAVAGAIDETVKGFSRIGSKVTFKGRETETPSGKVKVEDADSSRKLTLNFWDRIIIKDSSENLNKAVICPDYDVNYGYLNSIFTGNKHYVELASHQPIDVENTIKDKLGQTETKYIKYFNNSLRHFYILSYESNSTFDSTTTEIVGITDDQSVVSIGDELFKARAGETEEAWKYVAISNQHLKDKTNEYSSVNNENKLINSDIVRGSFGPYLVMNTEFFNACDIVNIYVPGYKPDDYVTYFMLRINDNSSYKAISSRINILELDEYNPNKTVLDGDTQGNYEFKIFRGDCYLCLYTHRLNRNFNDPSSPYNDEIVDENCWRDGYKPGETSDYAEINLGDVNAILLGMWLTFRIRSQFNLNIPTVDESNTSEMLMSGHARSRFPQSPMSVEGSYKIPDTTIYNKGLAVSLGERYNVEVPDVPYLKQWFGTRIMYSDLATTDSFKNGYRQFWSTNHQDYAVDYGSITKLVPLEGSLLCVFEHGIALIPVNERTQAGDGVGGHVYVNTNNVLPLNPNMLSDKFGSLWKDSVIKTDRGIVYGVDTVARKIWMYAGGNEIKCISDFSVLEFLNNNISLSERELDPIIGIRNVKTHYNAFKNDVMFTFYDNIYDFEEVSWNLCWNELLQQWVTFYSWIPSYSENIYNQYFSFNRDTSKYIAKLGISKAGNDFSDGVVLSENVLKLADKVPNEDNIKENSYLVGVLGLANRTLPSGDGISYTITYTLERDVWKNWRNFEIYYIQQNKDGKITRKSLNKFPRATGLALCYKGKLEDLRTELYLRYFFEGDKKVILDDPLNKKAVVSDEDSRKQWDLYQSKLTYPLKESGIKVNLKDLKNPFKPVIYLNIKAGITITCDSTDKSYAESYIDGFENRIKFDSGYYKSLIAVTLDYNLQFLTTDFWKHGQSGIIDIQDPIKPCYWYGKLHPFEFEFIVKDSEWNHKIFNNLHLLSNKAEPQSFHFEVVGESYDFAEDKINMYIRLEATKELYQYNGTDIVFDHDYKNLVDKTPQKISSGTCYVKSTVFPLYYYRLDAINEIEDSYHFRNGCNLKNYALMAGAEIVRYENLDEYRIVNHVPAINMKSWTKGFDGYREQVGRLRGNMEYKEDFWNVQINPINIVQNNEMVEACRPLDPTLEKDNKEYKVPVIYNQFQDCGMTYRQAIYGEDNDKITGNVSGTKDPSQEGDLTLGIPSDWNRNIDMWWGDMENQNKEVRIKDKYLKIRVRYSGESLAIITAIRTLYSISFG